MKRVLDPGRQLAVADLFWFLWISWLRFSFSPSLSSLGNLRLCQRHQACTAGPCAVGTVSPEGQKGTLSETWDSELSADPGLHSTQCLSAQVLRPAFV